MRQERGAGALPGSRAAARRAILGRRGLALNARGPCAALGLRLPGQTGAHRRRGGRAATAESPP